MEQEYIVTNELKSEPKVGVKVFISTFYFLMFYGIVFYNLKIFVHERLMIPYTIFSVVTGIFLTMPSIFNRKRKVYQSIVLYLQRDKTVYRPTQNVSVERKKELLLEKYKEE